MNSHTLSCLARGAVTYVLVASLGMALGVAFAQDPAAAPHAVEVGIPRGLEGITFPGALVLAAWMLRGWTPTLRHEHTADEALRKALAGDKR